MQQLAKNIKLTLTSIVCALLLAVSLSGVLSPAVGAQIPEESKNAACRGIGEATGGNSNSCDDSAGESLRGLLRNVINVLSWVVGVIAIIMIIIGGLKYVTSNGDSNGINSAKHTIMYALIGVAVAVLAQVLVRFVLQSVGDIKTTP